MARVRDLWHGRDRQKTARHPDNGGNPKAKRWLAVWVEPGGRERTQAFAKQSDAARYATSMDADALRGTYIDPKAARITVSQWCETWLAGYATRRPSTVRQARVHLRQITAEFGPMRLGAVRPSQVKSWTARLAAEDAAASYIYALHNRLAQVMADAVNDGLIARSPCSRRTSPGQGSQRPYLATTGQVWALHDAMPGRLRIAVQLGGFAGLRIAEACGLRVSDIDFLRRTISPSVQYPAKPLKTETSRTAIPIPESFALDLAAHITRYGAGGTVLTSRDGGQIAPWTLERAIRAARARVEGLPPGFRFHDLRHYLASLLIADGADVKTVQARLRHTSAVTTLNVYGHLWPDKDESTRATIEAVFAARAELSQNGEGAR